MLLAGGSLGKNRALPHSEGQPDGVPAPLHLPGPQARMVGLLFVPIPVCSGNFEDI